MNRQLQRHDWLLTLWWVKYWCFQVQVQIKIFTNANSKGKYEQTTPKAWLAADPLVSQDSYRSQGRESWGVETLCCFVWLSFTTTLAPTQFHKNNRFPILHHFQLLQAPVPLKICWVWEGIFGLTRFQTWFVHSSQWCSRCLIDPSPILSCRSILTSRWSYKPCTSEHFSV